jgi:hypothetical protein
MMLTQLAEKCFPDETYQVQVDHLNLVQQVEEVKTTPQEEGIILSDISCLWLLVS